MLVRNTLHCLFILIAYINEKENFVNAKELQPPKTIKEIIPPHGYTFFHGEDRKFAQWLLSQNLRTENTVYLYDGSRKRNQSAQFAVLDLRIGNKDLLQCADALMKMRAEFLYSIGEYSRISFRATSGDIVSFREWQNGIRWKPAGNRLVRIQTSSTKNDLQSFMDFVYSYCGTYSLSKQMKQVADESSIQPGDAFVEGGFPGHAVMVIAVAKNASGKKVFMLAQGYMPAQDLHILRNPGDPASGPWFSVDQIRLLETPEWTFKRDHLKRW